ncbi:MAG: S8 family peptidase [Candidatus Kariarchaeaceae archaeon]|jgi:subtilisin family serine protease
MNKKALFVIFIMLAAAVPMAVAASDEVPRFYLNDGFDASNLIAYAPPPGKGPGGGGGDPPAGQETDWGVARLGGFQSGAGITVAVLDSGVDTTHPDLAGVVTHCFSGISRQSYSDCTDRNVKDDDGHGTHVAGTIAALNNDIDTVGLAQGVSIISGKVLGKRGGDWYDLAWSIKYATDLGADVISMSLGGDLSSSATLQGVIDDAVGYATSAGVAVVVAAGNEGTCGSGDVQHSWPAESPGAFTVGATGIYASGGFVTEWTGVEEDVMPCFSNDMPAGVVDISAPGVYITASKRGGGVADMSGTSMATPHVSAALAILMAGGMSATQAQNHLVNNAISMGYPATLQGAGLMQL